MSIITISKTAYSPGKEVAERVAERLGFDCISREVLIEASAEFNVPQIKLLRAFRDAPSMLDRFTFGRERYVSYIQATLLEHFLKDDVVYHGLAGHHFVRGVSHVLKVRIIGAEEDRIQLVLRREQIFAQAVSAMNGLPGRTFAVPGKHHEITEEKARQTLKEIDEARRQWGLHLYRIDTTDPSLYDLVLRVSKLSIDDVVEIIALAAGLDDFQATAESQQTLENLALAARVKASLIEGHPRVRVAADKGAVYVSLEGATPAHKQDLLQTAQQVPGVSSVDVDVYPFVTPD